MIFKVINKVKKYFLEGICRGRNDRYLIKIIKDKQLLIDLFYDINILLDNNDMLNALSSLFKSKLGYLNFAIFFTDKKIINKIKSLTMVSSSGIFKGNLYEKVTFNFGENISGLAAKKASNILIYDLSKKKKFNLEYNSIELPKYGSILSIPMTYKKRVIGVVDFYKKQINAFKYNEIQFLSDLIRQIAIIKFNSDIYERILLLTISDPLTGIMNKRGIEYQIDIEINRSNNHLTSFALLMIDIDDFKKLNDNMGHIVGDIILKKITKKLKSSIRKIDILARFGGDEFCIILPNINESEALNTAKRLCSIIDIFEFKNNSSNQINYISISVGVIIYPDNIKMLNLKIKSIDLISFADQALYYAKKNGKNKVKLFTELKND